MDEDTLLIFGTAGCVSAGRAHLINNNSQLSCNTGGSGYTDIILRSKAVVAVIHYMYRYLHRPLYYVYAKKKE